jgi:maltooligosyltrehalose trehalohydrolase
MPVKDKRTHCRYIRRHGLLQRTLHCVRIAELAIIKHASAGVAASTVITTDMTPLVRIHVQCWRKIISCGSIQKEVCMFNLNEVGALVDDKTKTVTFSIYLPGIGKEQFEVRIWYIGKEDQFNKDVSATVVNLQPVVSPDPRWGDADKCLWQGAAASLEDGEYLYRYEIIGPSKSEPGKRARSIFFGDPFARETSSGTFSVFRIGKKPYEWENDSIFRVPSIRDTIIYEMNVAEFNDDFKGVIRRLPHLVSLGINVIELLPITSIAEPSQWGYMPIFYFAPEERYGGPDALKKMVQACHKNGIAVVLDMVYAHTDNLFAYQIGYERFFNLWKDPEYFDSTVGRIVHSPNPMVSEYSNYGHKNDFRIKSAMEFCKAVNHFWMDEYRVDGFRYDHVNGFLDTTPASPPSWDNYRPSFNALKELTNDTYFYSKKHERFRNSDGTSHIIQIAEDLNQSSYQLSEISGSAINGCWEERILDAGTDMAVWNCLNGSYISELLLSDNRWASVGNTKKVDGDEIPVSPIVYHNSHDKSHLMYRIAKRQAWDPSGFDYPGGIHSLPWYKCQPYAIALLTGVGTPMLWEGEEFAEAYGLPDSGQCRVRGVRPVHWDYFYTPSETEKPESPVLPLTTLYRHLCALRNAYPALRAPRDGAKCETADYSQKVIVYRRWLGQEIFVIAINFSETTANQWIPFGHQGTWEDVLDLRYRKNQAGAFSISINATGGGYVSVPSNFGRILKLKIE